MQIETDPDLDWVVRLSRKSPSAARAALDEARRESRLFAHLVREHASEGRPSYIEIDAPLELYALARLLRPAHVVEVGVSSGVSSAYLLQALERNEVGTLHSVDLPQPDRRPQSPAVRARASWSLPPGRSSGWAVPFRLRRRWDLRLGDKADVLPLLASSLPKIGLFVYDVPHADRGTRQELRAVDPRLPVGGVVIIDHGPGGELCAALAAWARRVGDPPVGRRGLGLYGARKRRRGGEPRREAAAARCG